MTELDDLKRKLKARRGKPGYGVNVAEIERRIAEIAELAFTTQQQMIDASPEVAAKMAAGPFGGDNG
jgi:hypothetical protein